MLYQIKPKFNNNMDNVIIMTQEQLSTFADEVAQKVAQKFAPDVGNNTDATSTTPKHCVYGIKGIANLFGVSHVTAQRYKDTFLQPAVMQRGRKIIVDADKALQLYQQRG